MIINVIDRPASVCLEHPMAFFIGPTAVDLSPVADAEFQAELARRKASDAQKFAKRAEGARRSKWQKPHAKEFY